MVYLISISVVIRNKRIESGEQYYNVVTIENCVDQLQLVIYFFNTLIPSYKGY